MVSRLFRSISFLAFAMLLTGASCPKLTKKEFDALINNRASTKVYFFASWCGSCRNNVVNAKEDDLLIATFDSQAAAEATLAELKIKAKCFTDDGIADALAVKSVPAVRNFPQ